MKKISGVMRLIMLSMGLAVPHLGLTQGTLYLSNMGDIVPTRAQSISADRQLAQSFRTGDNDAGYFLNSVDLLMSSAEGSPEGFSVSIYDSTGTVPGALIGELTGPDPAAGGVFNYVAEGITLSSSTDYFIAVASSTPRETGAYFWHSAGEQSPIESIDGWSIEPHLAQGNGTAWGSIGTSSVYFSVYATAIPEPSTLALIGGGAALFAFRWRRRKKG